MIFQAGSCEIDTDQLECELWKPQTIHR